MAGKLTQPESTLLYLRILEEGELRKVGRNSNDIEELAGLGWLLPTGLKDRYEVSGEAGRDSIEQRLDNGHPGWQELRDALKAQRLPMTMEGLKELELFRKSEGVVLPAMAHRKTVAAAFGLHSKTGISRSLREQAGGTILTTDQVLRMRANEGLVLQIDGGAKVDCDSNMMVLGEVSIPQRAFVKGFELGGRMPKAIFSIENLGSYVDFPDFSQDALLIFTPGDNTALTEELLKLLPNSCPHIHFGDLDAKGQEIARRLSRNCPQPMRIFIPEFWGESVEAFLRLEKVWPEGVHGGESPLIERLKRDGKWLEQEGIALDPRLERAIQDVIDEVIVFAE